MTEQLTERVPGEPPPTETPSRDREKRRIAARWILRYGTLAAFVVVLLGFYSKLPDSYLTLSNARDVLTLAAPLMLIAVALTFPLRVGDFDLSVGFQAQLYSAVVVVLMTKHGVGSAAGVIVTMGVGVLVGTIIGLVVAFSGVSAFIVTLAAGSLLLGAELGLSGNTQISEGIPKGFLDLATGYVFHIPIVIVIEVVFILLVWGIQDRTVWGRFVGAVGASPEAARLSGIRVEIVRTATFSLVGAACAVAGIIITAQAQAYYVNSATTLLLPAYAACFLGSTILRPGHFHVVGTALGVVFLQAVQNGIVQLNYSVAVANAVQGGLLLLAVMASQVGRRLTR